VNDGIGRYRNQAPIDRPATAPAVGPAV